MSIQRLSDELVAYLRVESKNSESIDAVLRRLLHFKPYQGKTYTSRSVLIPKEQIVNSILSFKSVEGYPHVLRTTRQLLERAKLDLDTQHNRNMYPKDFEATKHCSIRWKTRFYSVLRSLKDTGAIQLHHTGPWAGFWEALDRELWMAGKAYRKDRVKTYKDYY